MKRTKTVFTFFLLLLLPFIPSVSHALDTDLYVLSGADIPPNVLIILDNSASMDEVVSGSDADYSPDVDYGPVLIPPAIAYPKDEIYVKSSGNKWVDTGYATTSDPSLCADLVNNYLNPLDSSLNFGQAINYSNSDCGITKKDFQTGNFRNFLQIGGPGGNRSRFGLANGIIHSYINTTSGVRFGVMVFNKDTTLPTAKTVKYDKNLKLEYVDNPTGNEDAIGGKVIGFVDQNKNGKTGLFNNLSGMKNDTWSPLGETLYDAGTYFQSGKDGYSSPVQYYCQKNYVLIISDGISTKDSLKLDDVAAYLYGIDMSKGKLSDKQNIMTYTIGFSVTSPLLESAASNGGGRYFYVWSSQSFNIAFQTFIAEVLKESTSYVAPVVPISQMERTSAGNRIYLAMFKPTDKSFWKGNIKKYGLATKNASGEIVDGNGNSVTDPSIKVGDILDADGHPVMKSDNTIDSGARSYWSSTADGEDVEKGGVGEKLLNRADARKIYTYLGDPDLTAGSNAFVPGPITPITPDALGLASGDTIGRDQIINFVYGKDSYDWYGKCDGATPEIPDKDTNAKRCWILGAFIHSRPVVIHYAAQTVIYAGANDGMLHAFDDDSGQELWAFVPPVLLTNLQNMNKGALQFFVDGAPKAYLAWNTDGSLKKAILIFGLRRGGDHYYALDVTTYDKPTVLWDISSSTPGFGELGQTWSTPNIGTIKGWPNPVIFIGGGYDENQDNQPVVANDTKGRAIYVVDISDGSLIWSYSNAKNANMKYCIPSDISRVDTDGDSYIDRLYVGDVGGQVWRFDIGDSNPANWTAKVIFDVNKGAAVKRKIFYPPDVTLEKGNYEMIFFGTGDREHPKDTTRVDGLYAVKDKNPSSSLSESDLVDVTQDLLQEGTDSQKTSTLNSLQTQSGWFIQLNQNWGEKCLSNSVLFYGVVYYTTFQPTFGETGDVCFLGEGKARLYALNYLTGNAVFNLDGSESLDLTRSDRSAEMGASIPSGVIITFVGGTAVAYGGVGGGVYRPPLPTTKTVIPISWRIVF